MTNIKRTWIKLSESVRFEVSLLTEVVCLLALACNLLCHHVDVDLLRDHVCIRERGANQVFWNTVSQLKGARCVVIVHTKENISSLVFLLGNLRYSVLIHVVTFFDGPLKLKVRRIL